MSVAASAYARSSFSCATFATFVPGREAQLVARDVRPRHGPDHLRLHAEVAERLDQARRRALLAGGVRTRLLGAGARQQLLAVGSSTRSRGRRSPRRAGGPAGSACPDPSPPRRRSALSRPRPRLRRSSVARLRLPRSASSCSSGSKGAVQSGRSHRRAPPTCVGAHHQLAGVGLGRHRARSALSTARGCEALRVPRAHSRHARLRSIRVLSTTPLPVARSTVASEAPVSRTTPTRQQEDHEDVHADLLHQPVRRSYSVSPTAPPWACRNASDQCAPCARPGLTPRCRRRAPADRSEQESAAGAQRPQGGQHWTYQQRRAGRHQRDRCEHPRAPHAPAERHRQRVPDAARRPSLPYKTKPMNTPSATSASASTSRWRWSSPAARGGQPAATLQRGPRGAGLACCAPVACGVCARRCDAACAGCA